MQQLHDGPLTGETVLVTGATAGIGRATALGLAAMRARLAIVGRDGGRADGTAREMRAAGAGPVEVFVADMSDQAQVRRAGEVLDRAAPRAGHGAVAAAETTPGTQPQLAAKKVLEPVPSVPRAARRSLRVAVTGRTSGGHGSLLLDALLAELVVDTQGFGELVFQDDDAAGGFQRGARIDQLACPGSQAQLVAGVAAMATFGALRLDQFGGAQAAQERGADSEDFRCTAHAVGGVVLIIELGLCLPRCLFVCLGGCLRGDPEAGLGLVAVGGAGGER